MLEIDIRPFRGILLVRLSGELNKNTEQKLNKEVIKLQKKVGIKNIIFNVEELQEIDNYGKNALINSFNLCKKSYICLGTNKKIIKKLNDIFTSNNLVTDEMAAINLINS